VVGGERLVDRAVRVLRAGGCDPVLVVLGAWVGDVPGAEVVVSPDWQEGMGASLREGLRAIAERAGVDRVVVTLVDLPGLTGEAVRRIVSADSELAAASYGGDRGHPVLIGRAHWAPLESTLAGDTGARDYLSAHAVTLIEVGDVASGDDLDMPQQPLG